jgi:hypothetical protein
MPVHTYIHTYINTYIQGVSAKFESVKFLLSQDEGGSLLEDTLYRNLVLFGGHDIAQVLYVYAYLCVYQCLPTLKENHADSR